MTTAPRRQPAVIVGVDGSPDSRHALHWAAAQASRRRWPLWVLHAVEPPRRRLGLRAGAEPSKAILDAARTLVASAAADVERTWPGVPVTGHWSVGPASERLSDEAAAADLLVVGSRGLGRIRSALLGSVSYEVARHASCPVVVVRVTRDLHYPDRSRGVVVGVDGSAASLEATAFAFVAAAGRGLVLTAIHAAWDPNAPSQGIALLRRHAAPGTDERTRLDVAETIAVWRQKYPDVTVRTRYEYGRPAQVLADASAGADLLVVGAYGKGTAKPGQLGSVSRDVLRGARCPVAVVRGG